MNAIEIKNLKKTYTNKFEALKGVNLEIKKGDFFALLGPNGAGKSTIINILCSLVNKSSGLVKINNIDIDKDFNKAKSYLGVVPQEFNFSIFETVEQIIMQQAGYYGVDKEVAKNRCDLLIKELGLEDKRKSISRMLSGGMKRRLMIARALIHEPKILILDEPTAGVDIELRKSMWKFIKKINKEGTTIILTTHYLEEAEELCENIAIINNGKIIVNSPKKTLLNKLNSQILILELKNKCYEKINSSKFNYIKIDELTYEVKINKKDSLNDLFDDIKKQKMEISNLKNKSNRLEELFLDLTKKGGNKK